MCFNDYFFILLENLLVMEYADNGSLKDYLHKKFNKLTWMDKFELAYQLAFAVSFLHNKRIVHGDLVIHLNTFFLLLLNQIM
jgi:serine/threonine protein kinase